MTPSIHVASHNTRSFIERDYRKKNRSSGIWGGFCVSSKEVFQPGQFNNQLGVV